MSELSLAWLLQALAVQTFPDKVPPIGLPRYSCEASAR
jgi:hypothetical protein